MVKKTILGDRNFDDLAERFEQCIYGSSKGEIRQAVIWQDLKAFLPENKKLRVLDLGGGLGHFSIKLSQLGHNVCFNDISRVMTEKAISLAKQAGVADQIDWHVSPYQDFFEKQTGRFDLVLCHALLEWLEQPEKLFAFIVDFLDENAMLSLCFYNPAGMIYRNLIRGNFNRVIQKDSYQADKGSLTPDHPCEFSEVKQWLAENQFDIESVSGIRVFSDYAAGKRGGLKLPEAVLAMELEYSQLEPYKRMGRYLHIMASLKSAEVSNAREFSHDFFSGP